MGIGSLETSIHDSVIDDVWCAPQAGHVIEIVRRLLNRFSVDGKTNSAVGGYRSGIKTFINLPGSTLSDLAAHRNDSGLLT